MRIQTLALGMAAALAAAVSCGKSDPVTPLTPGGHNDDNPPLPDMTVTVYTEEAFDITTHSAWLGASYEDANCDIREVGFEWGTSVNSLGETLQCDAQGGRFFGTISGLGDNQTYWYRAYIILQRGSEFKTFYGTTESFTTEKQQDTPDPGTDPDPQPGSNAIGWYELPLMKLQKDGQYYVNASDNSQYYAWHLCSGGEKGPGGRTARNYTACYSAEHHCPLWIAAPRHQMYVGSANRTDAYRQDLLVPTSIQYTSTSVSGSGCNKGHMLGSAERTSSPDTNRDVFYYTNIAPQLSAGFNTGSGGWNLLEDYVDTQVCADTLYEVIGCYFDTYTDAYKKTQTPRTITYCGRSDVHMPTMFYYILLRTKSGNSGKALKNCSASELKCAAFVRAHTNELKGQNVTSKEMMSVSDLEKITGVTYFPNVPNAPKDTFTPGDWGL